MRIKKSKNYYQKQKLDKYNKVDKKIRQTPPK